MYVITAENVSDALSRGFHWLKIAGLREKSRNGPVIVAPGPVATTYLRPQERVLFNADRDANPVFHLMEFIWMMSGSNKVKWIKKFNSRFDQYAEPDGHIHGAYGYRWVYHFKINQLAKVVKILNASKSSRQAVIAMWDPAEDLGVMKNDIPCNTTIYFDCRHGQLNMTVCNRSNDILWGAYGANAVHMSMLQEFIADRIGMPMGTYTQFSNNFHAYVDVPVVQKFLDMPPEPDDGPYPRIYPLSAGEGFLYDCLMFTLGDFDKISNMFLLEVAMPLHNAYLARKEGRLWALPANVANVDWVIAFKQWSARRS